MATCLTMHWILTRVRVNPADSKSRLNVFIDKAFLRVRAEKSNQKSIEFIVLRKAYP
jgi:hypothetical protein